MILIAVGLVIVVAFVAFIFGYATGCMTGREEAMDLYNNRDEN